MIPISVLEGKFVKSILTLSHKCIIRKSPLKIQGRDTAAISYIVLVQTVTGNRKQQENSSSTACSCKQWATREHSSAGLTWAMPTNFHRTARLHTANQFRVVAYQLCIGHGQVLDVTGGVTSLLQAKVVRLTFPRRVLRIPTRHITP